MNFFAEMLLKQVYISASVKKRRSNENYERFKKILKIVFIDFGYFYVCFDDFLCVISFKMNYTSWLM